jgi:hypothetical protein
MMSVTAHAALTGRGKPVRFAALDQFDELVVAGGQVTLERLFLV